MPDTRPYLGFFPALPLKRKLELGDWNAGPLEPETPWVSDRFRELSTALVRSYEKLDFKGGALLWHRHRGFDGSTPSREEFDAIRAAVTFTVLDANDRLGLDEGEDDGNKGWQMATTENADLLLQPISEKDGGITDARGGALNTTYVLGLKIGDVPPALADAVRPISGPIPASQKLARAVFDAVLSGSRRGNAISVAAEWHRSAMANPRAVTMRQRLIALKTGFEALLGSSQSRACARKLRELFEDRTRQHRDLLPWHGLLWSPNDRTVWWWWWDSDWRDKEPTRRLDGRSEIEDWFMALADARNEIIHEGRLSRTNYPPPDVRPLSRYAGSLFWKGERILREAIKAKLGTDILLCGAIGRRKLGEMMFGEYVRNLMKRQRAQRKAAPPPPVIEPPELPPLHRIMKFLACPSAKYVTLSKAQASGSASLEVAEQMAAELADKWAAAVPGKSMLISQAEYEALKLAGAEDELPDYWDPCE